MSGAVGNQCPGFGRHHLGNVYECSYCYPWQQFTVDTVKLCAALAAAIRERDESNAHREEMRGHLDDACDELADIKLSLAAERQRADFAEAAIAKSAHLRLAGADALKSALEDIGRCGIDQEFWCAIGCPADLSAYARAALERAKGEK